MNGERVCVAPAAAAGLRRPAGYSRTGDGRGERTALASLDVDELAHCKELLGVEVAVVGGGVERGSESEFPESVNRIYFRRPNSLVLKNDLDLI